MSRKEKRFFTVSHPLILFGYAASCLALSLTGQYLCESAAFSATDAKIVYALAGLGQLSYLSFGIFMYRVRFAALREQKRAALSYFCRFAAACGFLVTVGETALQTVLWSAVLLFCLGLLVYDAFSRGEKAWLLCLPAAGTVLGAVTVTLWQSMIP